MSPKADFTSWKCAALAPSLLSSANLTILALGSVLWKSSELQEQEGGTKAPGPAPPRGRARRSTQSHQSWVWGVTLLPLLVKLLLCREDFRKIENGPRSQHISCRTFTTSKSPLPTTLPYGSFLTAHVLQGTTSTQNASADSGVPPLVGRKCRVRRPASRRPPYLRQRAQPSQPAWRHAEVNGSPM